MNVKLLMNLFRKIDAKLNINSYRFARLSYLNLVDYAHIIHRIVDKYRLIAFATNSKNSPIKLHLGCGEQRKLDRINIDWRKTVATDFVQDINALPLKEQSVVSIESYHVVEHLSETDAIRTFENWYKILKLNGQLVIECPDFDETVREYLNGNAKRIYDVYGKRRFPGDGHLFGYNFERLKNALTAVGFSEIRNCDPQDYHKNEQPCLRVEAVKK